MSQDSRNIKYGFEIPREGYCDQPYVVITKQGHWLCTMTTSTGEEGDHDQHVVATISKDQGQTWSPLIDIEPLGPPEASWVSPLLMPSGRIYTFYNYNGDNLREVIGEHGVTITRMDTLGHFVFKYSDDGGLTWSEERYRIPIRNFATDLENPYQGEIQFFWSVSKPIIHNGSIYMGLAKVGLLGNTMYMEKSEGVFLMSDNMLTETDPSKIHWETLPDGDIGLRAPIGPIADEHNLVSLSDGSLYCTFRTIEGSNGQAYSRDGGRTWSPPQYATYLPGGKRVKHPRAANFVRQCRNGNYILWFHNNGSNSWWNRNPVWMAGGVERGGYIHWSQPELLIYDEDPDIRISYPDFIEEDGRFFLTETQKTVAKVLEVDVSLLQGMWNQMEGTLAEATNGIAMQLSGVQCRPGSLVASPKLPDLRDGGGFAIDLWVQFTNLDSGQVLLDTRDQYGIGIVVQTTDRATVQLRLSDGRTQVSWDCDEGLLRKSAIHHIAISVDGGPKLITFVVDGQLCDGGEHREFGWGRFHPDLRSVHGEDIIRIATNLNGSLLQLRVYDRYLRTSEAIGNFRAGLTTMRSDYAWRDSFKLGINHHLLYPETFSSEVAHKRTLPYVLNSPHFEAVDMFMLVGQDPLLVPYEVELVRQSGKEVIYNGPLMMSETLNPHNPDPVIRANTLALMKQHADRARKLGARKLVVASGIDPGAQGRAEQRLYFVEYLVDLCKYCAPDIEVLIEPFDRSIGKNLLVGPSVESVAVVEAVLEKGSVNIGLLADMGHIPLMEESFEDALACMGSHIKHVHLGSCLMNNPLDPMYGDMHPPWGYPGGENDGTELVAFLQALVRVGYLGVGKRPTMTFEMRPYPELTEEESVEMFLAKLDEAWKQVDRMRTNGTEKKETDQL